MLRWLSICFCSTPSDYLFSNRIASVECPSSQDWRRVASRLCQRVRSFYLTLADAACIACTRALLKLIPGGNFHSLPLEMAQLKARSRHPAWSRTRRHLQRAIQLCKVCTADLHDHFGRNYANVQEWASCCQFAPLAACWGLLPLLVLSSPCAVQPSKDGWCCSILR